MLLEQNNKPVLFLQVSSFVHVELCGKRAKIETFNHKLARVPYNGKSAIAKGKRMHKQLSMYLTDFDRTRIMENLQLYKVRGAIQKVIEMDECIVVIRGNYDNLRVLTYQMKQYVSFLEYKTTGKKYMWSLEIRAAIRQLQIYLWMYKEIVEAIGYPLWKRHYMEEISQVTGDLIKRFPVEEDPNIEDWIRNVVKQFMGLAPMKVASYQYCKICPRAVQTNCSYYQMRRENNVGYLEA